MLIPDREVNSPYLSWPGTRSTGTMTLFIYILLMTRNTFHWHNDFLFIYICRNPEGNSHHWPFPHQQILFWCSVSWLLGGIIETKCSENTSTCQMSIFIATCTTRIPYQLVWTLFVNMPGNVDHGQRSKLSLSIMIRNIMYVKRFAFWEIDPIETQYFRCCNTIFLQIRKTAFFPCFPWQILPIYGWTFCFVWNRRKWASTTPPAIFQLYVISL